MSPLERVDVARVLVADPNTGLILAVRQSGGWSLPGGLVENGELLEEAAAREPKEEAGVDVSIYRLISVREWFHENHAIFFIFEAHIIAGEPHLTGDEEIIDVGWISTDEAKLLTPYERVFDVASDAAIQTDIYGVVRDGT